MLSSSNLKTAAAALAQMFHSRGWIWYSQPYQLNIVGIRSQVTRANSFDDFVNVIYVNDEGKWEVEIFPATTDPGTFWLTNPIMPQGTAILKAGQYVDAYKVGIHRGYAALQQTGKVVVLRDYNRNATIDLFGDREEEGLFGINIHRATANGTSKVVDKWSAGCQVLANSSDFKRLMELAGVHRKRYGNKFTYTLIDERSYHRARLSRQLKISGGILLITALSAGMILHPNSPLNILGNG